MTMPSSTSQSSLVEPLGIRTRHLVAIMVLGDLVKRIGLEYLLTGFGGVVSVVESYAKNLVWARNRCADAFSREPRRGATGNLCRQ